MNFVTYLESIHQQVEDIKPIKVSGKVNAVKGLIIQCSGINAFVSVGSRCRIKNILKAPQVVCEVVALMKIMFY